MSLNPFTNRRKKQEEAVEEKQREQMQQLQQLQAQQYQMRAQQEASFAPPTAGTVGVDVAISRRVERRARGCAMDVPNGGFVSQQACLNPRNHTT